MIYKMIKGVITSQFQRMQTFWKDVNKQIVSCIFLRGCTKVMYGEINIFSFGLKTHVDGNSTILSYEKFNGMKYDEIYHSDNIDNFSNVMNINFLDVKKEYLELGINETNSLNVFHPHKKTCKQLKVIS